MLKKLTPIVSLMFAVVFLFSVCAVSAIAQDDLKGSDAGSVPRAKGDRIRNSGDEAENFRADLINFVRSYKDAANLVSPVQARKFNGIEDQLLRLSTNHLNAIRSGMTDLPKLNQATQKLGSAVEKFRANSFQKGGSVITNSPGFPDADYPSCGTERIDDAIIDASDIALFVAEGVANAASRVCEQVVVAIGGGNASLACIATDAILLAAKAVNYGLHYCNDKIDSAEQGATYERLTHIHDDLEASVANDNVNRDAIVSTVNTARTAIINNDNANTVTITTAVENTKTAIINNANANKNELRDLILRTQIEADLAQNDNSSYVALYVTPTAKGGYLELARSIVIDTIAKLGGSSTSQANGFLSQGDAYKNAGDYKKAYASYRKAYKAATN